MLRSLHTMSDTHQQLQRMGSGSKRGIFPGNYGERLNQWETLVKRA